MNEYGSTVYKGNVNKGYAASYLKRLQDEEDERLKQAQLDQQKATEEQDSKPWYEKAGEWVGQAAPVVGDALFGAYDRLGKGTAEVLNELSGNAGKERDANSKRQADDLKMVQDLGKKIKEATTEEEKNRYRESLRKITEISDKEDADFQGRQAEIAERTDPAKAAGAVAQVGLDVVTGGTLKGFQVAERLRRTAQAGEKVGKAALREGAKGAAIGSAYGAADSLEQEGFETGVDDYVRGAALGGTVGGVLGAGIGAGGTSINNRAIRKAEELNATKNANDVAGVDAGVDDIAAGLDDELTKGSLDEAVNQAELDEFPLRDVSEDDLLKEIQDFNAGARSGDTKADYERQQLIRDELSTREREAYQANGGQSIEEAQKALDDFDNQVDLPDSVYKEAAPVRSMDELLERPYVPEPLKQAAQGLSEERRTIESEMDGLMTPDVKAEEVARLDEMYDMQLQDLTKRFSSLEGPVRGADGTVDQTVSGQRGSGEYKQDVRYTVAKDKLDEAYRERIAELDMLEAQDMADVEEFSTLLDDIATREQGLLLDSNNLIRENSGTLRDIDKAEFDAQRSTLEQNVKQAERFNIPSNVVAEVSNTPDPVKSFDRNPDAPEAFQVEVGKQIDEMTETVKKNFKNIIGVKLSALRLMSPSQVLEKWGLRGKELDLHTDILRAESELNRVNKADSEVLAKINKILPNSRDAQKQIVEYLEGSRQTLNIGDAKAAAEIKAFLDVKKQGMKDQGFNTLEDYFPHIFDKKDPDVQRLFKGKNNGEVSFGNFKSRMTDSDDYSRDIMDVLTTYANGYNRKSILEPALKPLADLRTQVDLQKAEADWLDGYIDQLMGFDKSKAGESYNTFFDSVFEKVGLKNLVGKNHYAETLGTQRMLSAVATMGLNPGTAIRNMTQMVNTVANIGPKHAITGAVDGLRALRAGKGSVEWAELQRAGIMEGGVSQNYFDAITKTGVRGRAKKGADAATKGMMSLIRATDVSLRAQAYYGAKALGRTKGLDGKALEDFAIRQTIDTQFITSRVDMPLAFNGQGVRSLTQLATFSGKQAGYLKRTLLGPDGVIKNKDGSYSLNPKKAASVLSAVAVAWGATEALKPAIGFRETEWIPFYEQVAPFFGAEGESLYRSPLVRLMAGDGKSKIGLFEAIQTGDMGKFFEDNWSQIVPTGTQIKKTVEGLETTGSGISKNSSGNIRYQQNTDPLNKVQASVFGQYSTPNGQQWIKDGFPTLSEEQTKTANSQLTPEAKSQYIDFYQAGKSADGRTKAYDAVKEALRAGNFNKANTLAEEYNAKLTKSMKSYWDKHDEMPEDLEDIMFNRMYINVSKAESNIEDE